MAEGTKSMNAFLTKVKMSSGTAPWGIWRTASWNYCVGGSESMKLKNAEVKALLVEVV